MRIAIVVQSEAFLTSAGVRIRYNRLIEAAGAHAATIEYALLDTLLTARDFPADVYIFTKTFNGGALALMAHLAALGRTVAQDLFDDYFSQAGDARLVNFRAWLDASVPLTHVAICTTEVMRDVLSGYFAPGDIHVIEDAAPEFDVEALADRLARKEARRRRSPMLRLAWFGIGDNPFFPVGVQDLVAHAGTLAKLARGPRRPVLRVLTNVRALTADALAALHRLPVEVAIEEWDVAAEAALLAETDVALLPVATQDFSRAKSLNRAVTSLCAGCQVLSLGHPLYARLGDFLYRDADALMRDLALRQPRLSPATASAFAARLAALADPAEAAERFVGIVRAAVTRRAAAHPPPGGRAMLCMIHGIASPGEQHKFASRVGGLSVKSPFHDARWNYHVRFESDGGGLAAFVDARAAQALDPALPVDRDTPATFLGHSFLRVPGAALGLDGPFPLALPRNAATVRRIAAYPVLMQRISEACVRLFPRATVVISDNQRFLPALRTAARAA